MKRSLPEPTVETPVKVRKLNKVGRLEKYDNNHKCPMYKLKFDDGKSDWLPINECKVLYTHDQLQEQADKMRKECMEEIRKTEEELKQHFDEYIKRLQAFTGAKTAGGVAKIVAGLIPGVHAAAEAGNMAAVMADLKAVIGECKDLASVMGDMVDMYVQGNADLKKNEAKLLKVLTRPTKILGEEYVGGAKEEPGKKVLEGLMKLNKLAERLETLNDMSFGPDEDAEPASSSQGAKTPEKPVVAQTPEKPDRPEKGKHNNGDHKHEHKHEHKHGPHHHDHKHPHHNHGKHKK